MNRGGSWNNSATNCRTANRNRNNPTNRNNNLGFRVALAQLGGGYRQRLNRLRSSPASEDAGKCFSGRPVLVVTANAPDGFFLFGTVAWKAMVRLDSSPFEMALPNLKTCLRFFPNDNVFNRV